MSVHLGALGIGLPALGLEIDERLAVIDGVGLDAGVGILVLPATADLRQGDGERRKHSCSPRYRHRPIRTTGSPPPAPAAPQTMRRLPARFSLAAQAQCRALVRGPVADGLGDRQIERRPDARPARGIASRTDVAHRWRAGRRTAIDAVIHVQVATEPQIADVVVGDRLAWRYSNMEQSVAAIPGIADPVVVVAIHSVVGPIGLHVIGTAIASAEDVHRHVGIDAPTAIHVSGAAQPCTRRTLTKSDGDRVTPTAIQCLVGIDGLVALEIGIGIDVDDPPHRALLGGQFADRRAGLGRGLGRRGFGPCDALAVAAHAATDPGRLEHRLGGIPRRARPEDHRIVAGDGELRPDIGIPGQEIHGIAFLAPDRIAVGRRRRAQRLIPSTHRAYRVACPPWK